MFDRFLPDEYALKARLQPALLTALPLAVGLLPWLEVRLEWKALWILAIWSGFGALVAGLVRDRGKRVEEKLFQDWGGRPTTLRLRHRGEMNPTRLRRLHLRLEALVPGIKIPSVAGEAADPNRADVIYEICVEELKRRTREDALVFAENCNYGFRRNLYGLKPLGLISASLGATLPMVVVLSGRAAWSAEVYWSVLLGAVSLPAWLVAIRSGWVRQAAEDYTTRLLESISRNS